MKRWLVLGLVGAFGVGLFADDIYNSVYVQYVATKILYKSTAKAEFRDTALYINSSADGQLDIDADTELELTAPLVDANAALDVQDSLIVGASGTSVYKILKSGTTLLVITTADTFVIDSVRAK